MTDYLLKEMIDVIANWQVYPKRMLQNIKATRGLIFSSGGAAGFDPQGS